MESKKPARSGTRARQATLAVAMITSACWSANAVARTQSEADCGARASLESITIADPVESLVLVPVDHVPTETDVSDIEAIHLQKATGDTGTPLLNLTPHVNNTLREVFGGDTEEVDETTINEVSSSPVAEHDDVKNLSELVDESTTDEAPGEDDDLALLRRQMYRIDI